MIISSSIIWNPRKKRVCEECRGEIRTGDPTLRLFYSCFNLGGADFYHPFCYRGDDEGVWMTLKIFYDKLTNLEMMRFLLKASAVAFNHWGLKGGD